MESKLNTDNSNFISPDNEKKPPNRGLHAGNVRIHGRRTSVRLEPEMWNGLHAITKHEGCSIHELCSAVHDMKEHNVSLTSAIRIFILEYFHSSWQRKNQK